MVYDESKMTATERARHEATSIKGDMPTPESIQNESAKWDKDGQLIDPEEIAKEKRLRDLALGKVKAVRSDFPTDEIADQYLGKGNDGVPEATMPVIPREVETSAINPTAPSDPAPAKLDGTSGSDKK